MKLTPVDIEAILHRMETGDTTIADANAMRAYHLSLRARIDEDLKEDDEAIVIPPSDDQIRYEYNYPDGIAKIEVKPDD